LFPDLDENEIKNKEDKIADLNDNLLNLSTSERELSDELKKILLTPDDKQLENQLVEYQQKTEEKFIALKT